MACPSILKKKYSFEKASAVKIYSFLSEVVLKKEEEQRKNW